MQEGVGMSFTQMEADAAQVDTRGSDKEGWVQCLTRILHPFLNSAVMTKGFVPKSSSLDTVLLSFPYWLYFGASVQEITQGLTQVLGPNPGHHQLSSLW